MTTTDGRTRTGGEHPGPADPSGHDEAAGAVTPSPTARTPEPDGGPAVARVRARRARPASGQPGQPGRHALPDDAPHSGHTPPPGYRPRHAAPDAETEQLAVPGQVPAARPAAAPAPSAPAPEPDAGPAADAPAPASPPATPPPAAPEPAVVSGPPTPAAPDPDAIAPTPVRGLPLASTFPASAVTASEAVPMLEGRPAVYGWHTEGDAADGPAPERVRIVLAERRSPTRAVGTVAEIEAQTATGELLLSNLMRSQLTLALRLAAVAVLVLGVLPIVFLTMPAVSEAAPVLGIGLPWLLLGVLAFPFLLVLGWLYTRHAERNELDFADDVED
ncbi:hypothetical protein [Actinomycetospora sp. TBRC 11914]|uniref:hypothetical protein n=1 Tax=Actinomycetospora sp. TBRC 11914 TaxID=2729387 RepID=UPI0020070EA6|nr:hypothetical protein [Actinomycetospora sp. TBRC 11914]